jgi:ribosomal protein S18 acetylase RimI-like enzyme
MRGVGQSSGVGGCIFTLRPASENDYELLWKIQRTAIGPYVDATWGWDEAFQRRFFDEHFDHRNFQIIRVSEVDVGFLSFEIRPDHAYLGNLALLVPYQSRGFGALVVQHVIRVANENGRPVRLQVLKSNPAVQFYARMGFSRCGETATHIQMSRACDPPRGDPVR